MHVTNGDRKHFVRYIAQYLADAFASSRRYSPTAPSPNCSSWFQGSSSAIILCLNACVIFAQEQLSDIKNNTNWSNTSVYRQGFVPRSARPSVFTSAFCKLPMKLEMKIMPCLLYSCIHAPQRELDGHAQRAARSSARIHLTTPVTHT